MLVSSQFPLIVFAAYRFDQIRVQRYLHNQTPYSLIGPLLYIVLSLLLEGNHRVQLIDCDASNIQAQSTAW